MCLSLFVSHNYTRLRNNMVEGCVPGSPSLRGEQGYHCLHHPRDGAGFPPIFTVHPLSRLCWRMTALVETRSAACRGRPQGIAPTMDERLEQQLRGRVGAIPCGRPARANAATLHLFLHSPTKSFTGRFFETSSACCLYHLYRFCC